MSISTDPFYDEMDREVDTNYCVHGTFIGNPYGADYLCGWCEEGVSLEDFQRYCQRQNNRQRRINTWTKFLAEAFDQMNGPLSLKRRLPTCYQDLVVAIVVNGSSR